MDYKLINIIGKMAVKEKQAKFYKSRPRIKGKIIEKSLTKKGNIRLIIGNNKNRMRFIILKKHKERFETAERLSVGSSVYAHGIKKLRMNICTKINPLAKGVDDSKQMRLV